MMTPRKHLTSCEVNRLLAATKGSRNEARDRCLLLLMFRHGLRVSEACGLLLSQVDLESRVLHVQRLKKGLSTTHPLRTDEIKVIKTWLKGRAKMEVETDAFFVSERRSPLNRKTAWLAIRNYGERAGLSLTAHPHMLRHACGFALADQGADTRLIQDYLGHRNIQHTVIYTTRPPTRPGLKDCGGREGNTMDLEALGKFLATLSGEEGFEPGRDYSAEMTIEEVKRIFGEVPLPGAIIAVKVRMMETSDSQYLSFVRKLQFLPGGKNKPREE